MEEQSPATGHSIELYQANLQSRAQMWVGLLPEERKRRAAVAVRDHDVSSLWSMMESYTFLFGRAGAGFSKHTAASYRGGLARFMEYASRSAVNLLRPEPEMGPSYIRSLEAVGLKPSTVRVYMAAVRMFYRALRWSGVTTADPFVDTHVMRDTTAPWDKRQPYTEEEVKSLLDVAPLRDQVLILLCAHAGLRIREALALTWGDVEDGVVVVQRGKGGKMRRVDCSRSLQLALQQQRDVQRYVSMTDSVVGGTYAPTCERLRRLTRRASVTYRAFHSFRHHAGTKLYRQTGRLEDAARHLGHSTIETTRIYAKWADDTVKKAVQDW